MAVYMGGGAPAVVQQNDDLRATAQRRAIKAKLATLKRCLITANANDTTSNALRTWVDNFSTALELPMISETRIRDAFIPLLQEILKDPIPPECAPLDGQALLGSDGRTYDIKAYSLYLKSAPPNLQRRSPIDQADPSVFTTEQHPTVPAFVQWLKDHDSHLQNPTINNRYRLLEQSDTLPLIPTLLTERIRALMELQIQREQGQAERIRQAGAEIQQNIRNRFGQIRNQAQQRQAAQIQAVQALGARDQARINQVARRVANLEQEIADLDAENVELQAIVDNVDRGIAEARREDAKLRIQINNTKKKIAENKKGGFAAFGTALLIVAGCAAGAWAFAGLVSAATSGAATGTVAATQGGAKAALIVTF